MAVDHDRFVKLGMAVGADDDVDARHRHGKSDVLAVGEASVLVFFHAAVAERDNDVELLGLTQDLHHRSGALDGIGELNRARAVGIELRFLAEHAEQTKADAAAFDHEITADQSLHHGTAAV